MRQSATLVILLVCGCTRPNLDYVHDSGAGGDNDFGQADSGAIPCTGDTRACMGATASGVCRTGVIEVDRTCPPGSTCVATVCSLPASNSTAPQVGQRCDSGGGPTDTQCRAQPNLACQPFVDHATGKLVWVCDSAAGLGSLGTKCSAGGDCKSGICTAAGICFVGCHSDLECWLTLRCKSLSVTVEGVTESAKSCATP